MLQDTLRCVNILRMTWTKEYRDKWRAAHKDHHIEYYAKHKERIRERQNLWGKKPENIEKARVRAHKWYLRTVDDRRANNRIRNRDKYQNLREAIIQKYGAQCNQCGINDHRVLQVDHINGGGRKELRTYQKGGSTYSYGYYKAVLKDNTDKYQLLCSNCNWIKRHTNNEVPYIK